MDLRDLLILWLIALTLAVIVAMVIRKEPFGWSRRRYWLQNGPVLLVFGIVAIVFGWVGWFTDGCNRGAIDSLYLATQQLYLNAPTSDSDNLAIRISRLFAIATIVLLGTEVIRLLFAESLHRVLLSVRRKDRTVILGLGHTGYQLLEELGSSSSSLPNSWSTAKKHTVVVVDVATENPRARAARSHGAIVVSGDAHDPEILRRIGAHHATRVIFALPSNGSSVTATTALADVVRVSGKKTKREWIVHTNRMDLAPLLTESVRDIKPEIDIRAFSRVEMESLDLLQTQLLDLRPTERHQVLHCVVVGMTPAGQLMAQRIAEFAHFENLKRTRMTIVYSGNERDEQARFAAKFPRLFPQQNHGDAWHVDPSLDDWATEDEATGVSFVCNGGYDLDDAAPNGPLFTDRLVTLAQTPGVQTIVFLCRDTANSGYITANSLRTELDERLHDDMMIPDAPAHPVAIFAYLQVHPHTHVTKLRKGLAFFGNEFNRQMLQRIVGSLDRKLGEAFASRYERDIAALRTAWANRSNLAAARHIHAKLAVVDLRVRSIADNVEPIMISLDNNRRNDEPWTTDEAITLARMEHNRWMGERLLSGWRFGLRSNVMKQRDTINDWTRINESERQKDAAQIQEAWRVCSDPHFKVEKRRPSLYWGAGHHAIEFLRTHAAESLVIGWTGHRDLTKYADPDASVNDETVRGFIESAVRDAVAVWASAMQSRRGTPSTVTGIGALADGADRIIAERFSRWSIAHDIVCADLGQANADPNSEYTQVRDAIVQKSDVIIAVWDGEPAKGPGGTGDVVHHAIRRGVPLLRIDPRSGNTSLLRP